MRTHPTLAHAFVQLKQMVQQEIQAALTKAGIVGRTIDAGHLAGSISTLSLSSATPASVGTTGTVGTSGLAPHGDHAHALGILTTKGDLLVFATTPVRMGVGTDGQVLTARSTAADGVDWETPAGGGSGMTNPMTTGGDVIYEQYAESTNWATAANGATVTVIDTFSGAAANIIDNNSATEWDSVTHFGSTPEPWFRIDLGSARAISAFRLNQYSDGAHNATQFNIQSSPDDVTYTTQYTSSTAQSGDTGITSLPSTLTFRYWKFNAITGANTTVGWNVRDAYLYTQTVLGPQRLAVGTVGQVLTVENDGAGNPVPLWQAASAANLPFIAFTPPPTTGWTWANQGTAAVDTTIANTIYIVDATGQASDSLRFYYRATPTPPYTLIAYIRPNSIVPNYHMVGIALSDGTGYITFGWRHNASSENVRLLIDKWTNATTFSANYITFQPPSPVPLWLKLTDDNTNRILSISSDGTHWIQVHSVLRTDFLTPTRIGLAVDANNNAGTGQAAGLLTSWAGVA